MDEFTFKLTLNTREQKEYNDMYEEEYNKELKDDYDFGMNGNIINRYIKLYKFWMNRMERDMSDTKKVEYIILRMSCLELELKTMKLWGVIKYEMEKLIENDNHVQEESK